MPIRPLDPSSPFARPSISRSTIPLSGQRMVRRKVVPPEPVEHAPKPPEKRAHHIVDRTTDNWDENGDYIVGKGRPPKAHQWKPGQSGNPAGPKPKEKLTPQEAFDRELLSEFPIKMNGEEVAVNIGTYVISLLKSGAAKGTVRSQLALLDQYVGAVRRRMDEQQNAGDESLGDQSFIEELLGGLGLPENPVIRKTRATSNEEVEQ